MALLRPSQEPPSATGDGADLPTYSDALSTFRSRGLIVRLADAYHPGQEMLARVQTDHAKTFASAGIVSMSATLRGICDLSTPSFPPMRHTFLERKAQVERSVIDDKRDAEIRIWIPHRLPCACGEPPASFPTIKGANKFGATFEIFYSLDIEASTTRKLQRKISLRVPFIVKPLLENHLGEDTCFVDDYRLPTVQRWQTVVLPCDKTLSKGRQRVSLDSALVEYSTGIATQGVVVWYRFNLRPNLRTPANQAFLGALVDKTGFLARVLCIIQARSSDGPNAMSAMASVDVPPTAQSKKDVQFYTNDDGSVKAATVEGSILLSAENVRLMNTCHGRTKYFLNFVVGITTKTPLDFHIQLFKPITNETFVEYNLPPQFNEIQRGSTDDPPSFAESAPG